MKRTFAEFSNHLNTIKATISETEGTIKINGETKVSDFLDLVQEIKNWWQLKYTKEEILKKG